MSGVLMLWQLPDVLCVVIMVRVILIEQSVHKHIVTYA